MTSDDSIAGLRNRLAEQLAGKVEAKLLDLFNLGIDPATVGRSGVVAAAKGSGRYAFYEDLDLTHAERMSPERKAEISASLLATGRYRVGLSGRIERDAP